MELKEIEKANTKYLGKKVIYYEEIESTHKKAKELATSKTENGTIIIADKQTGGIGTKGRSWYTGNNNIAMTIIIYPEGSIKELEGLTIEIAKSMQSAIKELYKYNLQIKQPNDLILNGKKISGILTQASTQNGKIKYLLISIGFNVNEENFSEETQKIATSLKKEYKNEFQREGIIIRFLEILENKIAHFIKME